MTLEEETESRVWAANEKSMNIVGLAKAQVKIEHAMKICNFWVTPSMSERVILLRLELIPKSFINHEELRRRSPDVSIVCKNHTSEPFCNIG